MLLFLAIADTHGVIDLACSVSYRFQKETIELRVLTVVGALKPANNRKTRWVLVYHRVPNCLLYGTHTGDWNLSV